METKLLELKSNKELLNAVLDTKYKELIQVAKNIVLKWFLEPYGGTLTRLHIREEDNRLLLSFDVGFNNEDEGRIDFGSDVTFYFDKNNKLGVNYGTIGTFTSNNTYQVKRLKLLAGIFDNIELIEADFIEFVSSQLVTDYLKLEYEDLMCDIAIRDLKTDIKKTELKTIENNLVEGSNIRFTDSTEPTPSCWKILKISDKTMKLENKNGIVKRYSKDAIVELIYNKKIIIEETNE